MSAYRQLTERFRRILLLDSVQDVLHWDTASMLPEKSGGIRGDQLALLRVVAHETITAADIPALLDDALAHADELDDLQRANLNEMRRRQLHAAAVPADLVAAWSRACTRCEQRWRQARRDDDFNAVTGDLKEVLSLTRQSGEARAAALGVSVYDALLDQYEPGLTTAAIDALFQPLAAALPELLQQVLAQQAEQPAALALTGPFPIEAQRALAVRLMKRVGFDFDQGRLDVSLHPFCGGSPDDVRITTRYDETDFTSGLIGVLHETGHAMYERGLPAQWRHQPLGKARGMAVHESQSLLLEMQVCRSQPFLAFAAPHVRQAFAQQDDANAAPLSAANLYRIYNKVEPGFIRVDADEVTYPAHVMLRYDLEKSMLVGDLGIDDLPTAWNEGMRRLLGITPPNHRLGCLQDIHWFGGDFGYFPCYTLGAILAAQLYRAACEHDERVQPAIAAGNFAPLMSWLRENVHSHGARYQIEQLAQRASGKRLDVDGYLGHLRARYLS